jgi:hypothetical protein
VNYIIKIQRKGKESASEPEKEPSIRLKENQVSVVFLSQMKMGMNNQLLTNSADSQAI